jgi:uncharacterized membrane protein
MSKSRFEAFTDAIIAIVMTVLVLNLDLPKDSSFSALLALKNQFLIYFVSFFILAIYWNNHHQLVHAVKKIDGVVLWANNIFILSLTLFPFATSWVSSYPHELTPQIAYAIVLLIADTCFFFLCLALMRINSSKSKQTMVIIIISIILGIFTRPELIIIINSICLLPWILPYKKKHTTSSR